MVNLYSFIIPLSSFGILILTCKGDLFEPLPLSEIHFIINKDLFPVQYPALTELSHLSFKMKSGYFLFSLCIDNADP